MGIIFQKFGKNEMSQQNKNYFTNKLKTIDHMNELSRLNVCYNNPQHGLNILFSDISSFLNDIGKIARSKHANIVIHGNEHTDPFGHTSFVIVAIKDFQTNPFPTTTKDTYITFEVQNEINHCLSRLSTIIPNTKYHLITQNPEIIYPKNMSYFTYCAA